MIFIHIHFFYDFCPFRHKLPPLFLKLIINYIRIGKQPLISGFSFLFDFPGGNLVDEVEVDRDEQTDQLLPDILDVSDDFV